LFDLVRLPIVLIRRKLQTSEGKISLVIWTILSLLWFIYFIQASVQLANGSSGNNWRLWKTVQSPPKFPQFIICPQYPEGSIEAIECNILQSNPKNPIITPTLLPPGYLTNQGKFSCYGYNLDGTVPIGNHTVWCKVNATNGWVSPIGHAQVYFDPPGTLDIFDCDQCVQGQDNYVMNWGNLVRIALELEIFKGVPQYSVYPSNSWFSKEERNITHQSWNIECLFFWDSDDVWNYAPHSYYSFWSWIGFLGGAAFLLNWIHDITLAVMTALLLGVEESQPQQYQQVQ